MSYAIEPDEVLDMMRRYDVEPIDELNSWRNRAKPYIPYIFEREKCRVCTVLKGFGPSQWRLFWTTEKRKSHE